MTAQFVCGAECQQGTGVANITNGIRHWNADTGTVTVVAGFSGGGSAAYQVDTTGGAAATYKTKTIAQLVLAGRVYFALDTLPAATTGILYTVNATAAFQIRINSSGQLIAQAGAITANIGSPVAADGAEHYVDFLFDASGTSGVTKAKLDGGTEAVATSAVQASANHTTFRMGSVAATTIKIRFDHLWLADAAGDYPLGAGQVTGYVPNGTSGTHNQTAGDLKNEVPANITNGDTSSTKIDEQPANTTDYIAQVVIRTTTYYEAPYATSGETKVPRAVEQSVSLFSSTATAQTEKTQLYDGTSAADAYVLGTISSASIVTKTKCWAAPPSGGAWTAAKFQAARIRWGFSDDVTPNPRLSSTILEAEFALVTSTNLNVTDTGGDIDVSTLLATQSRTEAGGDIDTSTQITAIVVTDAGTTVDAPALLIQPKVGTPETATGSDVSTEAVATPVTEAPSGADVSTETAVQQRTDAGTAVDAPGSVTSPMIGTPDTGAGADVSTETALQVRAEAPTGADVALQSAAATATDAASAADASGQTTSSPTGDTAAGSEIVSARDIGTAEAGASVDVVSGLQTDNSKTASDAGAASDVSTMGAAGSVVETPAGADVATPAASNATTEGAAGNDASTPAAAQSVLESGTESELASGVAAYGPSDVGNAGDVAVFTVAWTLADSGTTLESATPSAALARPDTGSAAEVATLATLQIVFASDVATAADTSGLAASFLMSDTGSGDDASDVEKETGIRHGLAVMVPEAAHVGAGITTGRPRTSTAGAGMVVMRKDWHGH